MTDEYIQNIYRKIPLMPYDTLIPIDQNRPDLNDMIQVITELIASGQPLVLSNDRKWLTRLKKGQYKHPLATMGVEEAGLMQDGWKKTLKGGEWLNLETKQGLKRVYCESKYYEITNEHGKVIAIESKKQ